MNILKPNNESAKQVISHIEVTTDCLSDRGGLAPLMRYLDGTELVQALSGTFSKFRQRESGMSISDILRQVIAFFLDGSSTHLTYFDHLKKDPGYCAILETDPSKMASSHAIKRFFGKMSSVVCRQFRFSLRKAFTNRVRQEKPEVLELFLDTMVLDNDDASCRQGVSPTYKKVQGFQPLQLIWDGQVIDAQFRGGSKNGNHGLTAVNMIKQAVRLARKELGSDLPVIVRMDGGFFDGDLFRRLDVNNIGFVCTARQSKHLKEFALALESTEWKRFSNERQTWSYTEFGTRCLKWKRFYRVVYMKPDYEGDQRVFDFARRDQAIITNMGSYRGLFLNVPDSTRETLFQVERLIREHHAKGADELTHRGIKDFGFEKLPFKAFGSNVAFYYLMIIAYNIMTWYKRDVLQGLVGRSSYATTVRRQAIDFAAKIVKTGRKIILKVTTSTMERLRLDLLWERCNKVPKMIW